MSREKRFWMGVAVGLFLIAQAAVVSAQEKFTIEQVLSAPFVTELVSAKKVERIGWMEFQMGKRNVFTAEYPTFTPRRLRPRLPRFSGSPATYAQPCSFSSFPATSPTRHADAPAPSAPTR